MSGQLNYTVVENNFWRVSDSQVSKQTDHKAKSDTDTKKGSLFEKLGRSLSLSPDFKIALSNQGYFYAMNFCVYIIRSEKLKKFYVGFLFLPLPETRVCLPKIPPNPPEHFLDCVHYVVIAKHQ